MPDAPIAAGPPVPRTAAHTQAGTAADTAARTTADTAAHTDRVSAVDAVRGLALCGILVTNIPQLTLMPRMVDGEPLTIPAVLELTAHQRFMPIFAFLFGLGFSLFLDGASRRVGASRRLVPMLRRLAVLAVLGLVHQLFQPGEALLSYAIVGAVVLIPASLLPRPLILLGGLVGTLLPLGLFGGGIVLVPGLFLLGLATARYGIVHTLAERGRATAALCLGAAIVAAVALPIQADELVHSGFNVSSGVAGIALAVVYVTGLLLLLRTPLGPGLSAVCAPLGRMALTNYLSATAIVLLAAGPLGLPGSTRWDVMLLLALSILVTQCVASRWWLRRFAHGPVEWVWRCVTWWERVPNRRRAD
ncbi:putative membrane protein YeiB [Actinoalloteichus hoggarensis]|uniref:DUF418 domain-containing protein n=1 Tax=Actinoalloteichus hoggarensis TaxID=1470176 RepID=A0A221VYH8_9PSEU|nr:DUF418 domain-containing protein [Actinoalloteichus hoggarensis]ASO18593.1 hypothetical protein AHOG_04685 [Actinoalloteichus hoggarensis]MBB5921961.1 putative membrane protein YeiB [Actinoalloteichus hoggarensis]